MKIVKGYRSLSILQNSFIEDYWLGPKYASVRIVKTDRNLVDKNSVHKNLNKTNTKFEQNWQKLSLQSLNKTDRDLVDKNW